MESKYIQLDFLVENKHIMTDNIIAGSGIIMSYEETINDEVLLQIVKSFSSLSNTNGGKILIGIDGKNIIRGIKLSKEETGKIFDKYNSIIHKYFKEPFLPINYKILFNNIIPNSKIYNENDLYFITILVERVSYPVMIHPNIYNDIPKKYHKYIKGLCFKRDEKTNKNIIMSYNDILYKF